MAPVPLHAPIGRGLTERRLTAEHLVARALVEASTFDRGRAAAFSKRSAKHSAGNTARYGRSIATAMCFAVSETWHSPSMLLPEFEAISRGTSFRRGVGLPGRVWATSQPAWIPDVVEDANFPRAAIAAREGLHARIWLPDPAARRSPERDGVLQPRDPRA